MTTTQTWEFIRRHADDDVRKLALQTPAAEREGVDMVFALDQIRGRQTAMTKLPQWAATDGVVYPPHLSMEQCSSEATARYKEEVALAVSALGREQHAETELPTTGNDDRRGRFVDLTGGFGVDFSYMSRRFGERVYVERNPQLCAISSENFRLLGLTAEVVCGDGVEYLKTMPPANVIFLDPARRDDHGARTYGIADCTPDVGAMAGLLLQKAPCVMVKLSPMLDWRQAVRELLGVAEVHIVAVEGECKELLLVMTREWAGQGSHAPLPRVVCADLNVSRWEVHPGVPLSDGPSSSGVVASSSGVVASSSGVVSSSDVVASSSGVVPSSDGPLSSVTLVGSFLHIPNAAVMKSGCFAELSHQFGVCPLAANSHLFVAGSVAVGFPGRVFHVEHVTTMNKKELRRTLSGITHANIAVRNFPLTVAELRKRLKLRDGGDTYLFATTLADGQHILLLCRR